MPAPDADDAAYDLSLAAALRAAAASGDTRTVVWLLQDPRVERQIDAADAEGRTALHRAAAGDHEDAAQALLLAGADLDAADHMQRWTPLHAAAAACSPSIVQLLLNHGADASRADARGRLPLHLAAQACAAGEGSGKNAPGTVAVLARHCPAALHQQAHDGDSPAHVLCREVAWMSEDALAKLRDLGLLNSRVLTCTNKAGRVPLAEAILSGHSALPALLLPLCPAAVGCTGCSACARTAAAAAEEEQEGVRWGSDEAVRASCAGHTCALAAAASKREHGLMLHMVGLCGTSAAGLSSHVLGPALAAGRDDVAAALLAAGLRCRRPALPLVEAVEAADAVMLRSLLRAGEAA